MNSNQALRSEPAQGSEYTIYTFDRDNSPKNISQWQKHDTLVEMDKAMDVAQNLFKSGRYRRIEVKQKYFDPRMNRKVDMTLKTFGAQKTLQIGSSAIILFAALCATAAFIATYII